MVGIFPCAVAGRTGDVPVQAATCLRELNHSDARQLLTIDLSPETPISPQAGLVCLFKKKG